MKVLMVCGGNGKYVAPFITDQVKALEELGIECNIFTIKGKGIVGYLRNLPEFLKVIKESKPDIIHAHYVLSGLLALLQLRIPVVVSFIGTDILTKRLRILSKFVMIFTKNNIFVSQKLFYKVNKRNLQHSIIQYGVRLKDFFVVDRNEARSHLGLKKEIIYCLFPSSKNRIEKNYKLANYCINSFKNIELLELGKGYSIEEVNLLYNACDFLLLTSFHEGGPQVIKEAMACNLPIVSTDVGDVRETIGDTEGCFICTYDPEDVIEKIKLVLKFGKRINGRERIKQLNIETVKMAEQLINVYKKVLAKR